MKWSYDSIPDVKGKVIIVTGSNSGIGFHKARYLAKHNALVVMGVRSLDRGKTAADKILKEFPYADIDILQLDLGDSSSIKNFSTEFHKKYDRLDVLVNNAGIMTTPYNPTKDGFESQIGVNHFGHFLLTSLLFDLLKKTPSSRIVNTASIAHRFGKLKKETFMYEEGRKYNKSTAYAQSKLANLLFTYKLASLVEEHNLDIKVTASHPGISQTDLGRHLRDNWFMNFMMWFIGFARQTGEKGSLPGLRASTDSNVKNGEYYGPRGLYNTKGFPNLQKPKKKAHNKTLQDLLWDESIRLTNTTFDFK